MVLEAQRALAIAQRIKRDAPTRYVPPSEGTRPDSQSILPHALVKNTRGYIEKVVFQINGCYERGWYDACAVMIRKVLETLIIECFEEYGIASKIKNSTTSDFFYLSGLIDCILKESSWSLGRNTRQALPRLKSLGDMSAHSRRYVAYRQDIDKLSSDFRIACEELLYIAKLK